MLGLATVVTSLPLGKRIDKPGSYLSSASMEKTRLLSFLAALVLAVGVGAQTEQSVGSSTVTTTVLPNGNHEIKVTTGDAESALVEPPSGINVTVPAGGNSAIVTLEPGQSVKITVGSDAVTLKNTPA